MPSRLGRFAFCRDGERANSENLGRHEASTNVAGTGPAEMTPGQLREGAVLAQEIHFAYDQYRCRRLYGLELARHSSHISSALTLETLLNEIGTAVSRFKREHGTDDLHHFLLLLARRLEERGRSDAVVQVLHYAEFGAVNPVTDRLSCARQQSTAPAEAGTRTLSQTL